MISPDKPEKLRKMEETLGLTFTNLVDADLEVIKAYGVLNETSGTIPHPAALIIDRAGIIRYFRVDEDYKIRPSTEELLTALEKLEEN